MVNRISEIYCNTTKFTNKQNNSNVSEILSKCAAVEEIVVILD